MFFVKGKGCWNPGSTNQPKFGTDSSTFAVLFCPIQPWDVSKVILLDNQLFQRHIVIQKTSSVRDEQTTEALLATWFCRDTITLLCKLHIGLDGCLCPGFAPRHNLQLQLVCSPGDPTQLGILFTPSGQHARHSPRPLPCSMYAQASGKASPLSHTLAHVLWARTGHELLSHWLQVLRTHWNHATCLSQFWSYVANVFFSIGEVQTLHISWAETARVGWEKKWQPVAREWTPSIKWIGCFACNKTTCMWILYVLTLCFQKRSNWTKGC